MFWNKGQTYKITIPMFASKDVIDWFEKMAKEEKLSDEIVGLVDEKIKSMGSKEVKSSLTLAELEQKTSKIEPIETIVNKESLPAQKDLINSLYDWQESAGALFAEEVKHQKEKKRMLQV